MKKFLDGLAICIAALLGVVLGGTVIYVAILQPLEFLIALSVMSLITVATWAVDRIIHL